MSQYLPMFRPGDTVTFNAAADVVGGQPVEVGAAAWSVIPASAASAKYVGVAGHDAKTGEKVTIEVGKPIHELVANAAITLGAQVEAAGDGKVRTHTTGTALGLALSDAAAADALVAVMQF